MPVNPGLQFVGVALPIMVTLVATIWIASWSQNKRFDDLRSDIASRFADVNRRFDDVNRRFNEVSKRIDEVVAGLRRLEQRFDDHEQRIVRV